MVVYTIGFTKKPAAEFFGTLRAAGIKRLIDVRLNNSSQLAGFTKKDDLAYFLREICDADYVHELLLAPEHDLFDAYRKNRGSWEEYERRFLELMALRRVEKALDHNLFSGSVVLLCSEPTAEHCHRRLVAEYLQSHWANVAIRHL